MCKSRVVLLHHMSALPQQARKVYIKEGNEQQRILEARWKCGANKAEGCPRHACMRVACMPARREQEASQDSGVAINTISSQWERQLPGEHTHEMEQQNFWQRRIDAHAKCGRQGA